MSIVFDVLTFILALVGAITGILFLKEKWTQHITDRSFRQLFAIGKVPTVVICPTQTGLATDPNKPTTFEDAMAQTYIVSALASRGLFAKSQLHDQCTEATKKSNLFLICGPAGNSVTNAVFNEVNLPFRFEQVTGSWQIREAGSNSVFARQETIDYAIVAAIKNPWELSTRIWIAAGISGLGTMGAAYLLAYKSRELGIALKAKNIKLADSFAAVVAVVQAPTGPESGIIAIHSAA